MKNNYYQFHFLFFQNLIVDLVFCWGKCRKRIHRWLRLWQFMQAITADYGKNLLACQIFNYSCSSTAATNEIQLLSRFFRYSKMVCLFGFWAELRHGIQLKWKLNMEIIIEELDERKCFTTFLFLSVFFLVVFITHNFQLGDPCNIQASLADWWIRNKLELSILIYWLTNSMNRRVLWLCLSQLSLLQWSSSSKWTGLMTSLIEVKWA